MEPCGFYFFLHILHNNCVYLVEVIGAKNPHKISSAHADQAISKYSNLLSLFIHSPFYFNLTSISLSYWPVWYPSPNRRTCPTLLPIIQQASNFSKTDRLHKIQVKSRRKSLALITSTRQTCQRYY